MATEVLALLKAHPVFSCLDEASLLSLAELALVRRCAADEFLVFAGDRWPYLFLVAEGSILALKESSEGRSLIVAEIGAGEVFWGVAFFETEMPNPVTLRCREMTKLYLWQGEEIRPLLLANGRLTWELARAMVRRMLRASEVIEGLAFQPVAGRLARLLLEQAPPDRQSLPRSLTLDELAARLGTSREVVCRTLYRFAGEGLINITRTEFTLTDRDGLARLLERT
ncbi:MAG: Crp/Fnr family transcriptional regulator [Anaerolineales bacterium]